jgi:hypothetical protein
LTTEGPTADRPTGRRREATRRPAPPALDRHAIPSASLVVAEFRRSLDGHTRREGLDGPVGAECNDLIRLLLELLDSNLAQWELEDLTRSPDASDTVVAEAKRSIDRLNLGRHHLVERIDATIAAAVEQSTEAVPATESPAMAFDRLSVLAIRNDRAERAGRRSEPDEGSFTRLARLQHQLDALSHAIDALIDEVWTGGRRFVPYEHLKMYSPPLDHPTREADSHPG